MNKFTILFLSLFLALPIAMKADSAKEKKEKMCLLIKKTQLAISLELG